MHDPDISLDIPTPIAMSHLPLLSVSPADWSLSETFKGDSHVSQHWLNVSVHHLAK